MKGEIDTHEVYEKFRKAHVDAASIPAWDDLEPWMRRALIFARRHTPTAMTKAESAASKVLKDPKASKSAKAAAASVLTQVKK